MKIYLIGQKGIPARAGGIERHVEELATRLVKHGHEVVVFCRSHYTPKTMQWYKGVQLVHLPTVKTKHLDAITHTLLATVYAIVKRPDVIHYHGVGPAILSWIPRLMSRATILFTFHCQDYHHQKWNAFARLALRVGESIGVRAAHGVITVSKTLTKYVWARYLIEATYVPNGAEPIDGNDADETLSAFGLKSGGYVLAVARLVRHKAMHELISAFGQLATDAKLVIAGDGAYTDDYVRELKAQAARNPNVKLIGNQSAEVLAPLYRNAALLVQPSHAEGLSVVLLEGMRYGACVLASGIPENREVVEEGGFLFRAGSVSDLIAKLRFLLERPEICTQSGHTLQVRAENEYNWDAITTKTIDSYYGADSKKRLGAARVASVTA
jgi:glycosyltransferase involved in cell wall biosynthesis